MRSIRIFVAAALTIAVPSAALAVNPAAALSVTRAGASLAGENSLTKGELYPLLGLALLAVLAITLLDDDVDENEPMSA